MNIHNKSQRMLEKCDNKETEEAKPDKISPYISSKNSKKNNKKINQKNFSF
jgi:hypothetical protein